MNMNVSRAEIKAQAKEQLRGKVWMFFLVNVIVYAILIPISFLAEMEGAASIIGLIAMYVVTPPLEIGLVMVYLDVTYGDPVEISTLFKGFKMMGKSIALFLWMLLFILLWSCLFIIPGIIKSYSYSMAWYILAENPDMTAREALTESKIIMNGHKFDFFVLQLSFFLWAMLIVVTLGIAAIYVSPYQQLTFTNFYHHIKRQPAAAVTEEYEEPVYTEPVADVIE
mgnify:FL=1